MSKKIETWGDFEDCSDEERQEFLESNPQIKNTLDRFSGWISLIKRRADLITVGELRQAEKEYGKPRDKLPALRLVNKLRPIEKTRRGPKGVTIEEMLDIVKRCELASYQGTSQIDFAIENGLNERTIQRYKEKLRELGYW